MAFLVGAPSAAAQGLPAEGACPEPGATACVPGSPALTFGMSVERALAALDGAVREQRTADELSLRDWDATEVVTARAEHLGLPATLNLAFFEDRLGSVAVVVAGEKNAHARWLDLETRLVAEHGPPALRAPFCRTKHCGDDLLRMRPEDVGPRVNEGDFGLQAVWTGCPVRVRLRGDVIVYDHRRLEAEARQRGLDALQARESRAR